jgi:hypothetical protein
MPDLDGAKYTSFDEYQDAIDDTEAARIFVDVLQRNPEVCSNCFLKLRDVVFPHDSAKSFRSPNSHTWKGLVRHFLAKPDRVERAAVDSGAGGQPTNCENCGSIRGATRRPLSRPRAIEFATNLSETLTLLDVDHNPLLLQFVVTLRNLFPRFATRDDDTFRTAVEYAIDDTDHTVADLFADGPRSPVVEDADPFPTPPKLPPADDSTRRRSCHGRPRTLRRG